MPKSRAPWSVDHEIDCVRICVPDPAPADARKKAIALSQLGWLSQSINQPFA
jgi:hypothetical protein